MPPCFFERETSLNECHITPFSVYFLFQKGVSEWPQFVSTIKYARYAMGSLTAVLFLLRGGGP